MFTKVLVANRGEIALRIIRTLKEMGVKAVAVYSDVDIDSLHVKFADEAVNIGSPLAKKSYLNIDKIIDAAKKTRCEAIHPGYGFLAENAAFVKACEDSGITFIGPSEETQRLAGEKIEAKNRAQKAGIPVLPGSNGAVLSVEEALKIAQQIKYPLIVKASGGGGGKGMRVASNDEQLREYVKICSGEARAAFGNPSIYIEKYLIKPRHIEFQVLADAFGNYLHLGERECSIQRNYQKLIEEAPSPFLDDFLRAQMGDAAIKIMRAVSYTNAGTVEFLVDEEKNFYFNEINSRLQVEHPVTEMITSVDLVEQQILIACGNKLKLGQMGIEQKGWSLECRINAEDPFHEFRPSPGKVTQVVLPGGPNVRVDSCLFSGYEVSPFYDSLVGKIIVWGNNRNSALLRMRRALGEVIIHGIHTTIGLHRKVLCDPDFIKGNINTGFMSEKFERLVEEETKDDKDSLE